MPGRTRSDGSGNSPGMVGRERAWAVREASGASRSIVPDSFPTSVTEFSRGDEPPVEEMGEDWTKYTVDVGLDNNLGATLRVSPDESPSGIAVVEHTLPAGKPAAPLHRHTHEDEISYILTGTMGVQEGGDVRTVEAGEFAVKERGVWHTFWNPGDTQLRFLEFIVPGAFAGYFEAAAEILPDDGEPDEATRNQIESLHDTYGFELDPESVPALIERHDLER